MVAVFGILGVWLHLKIFVGYNSTTQDKTALKKKAWKFKLLSGAVMDFN